MSWNEPGDDKKDPWGERGDRGDAKGPPDLDAAIRSLQEKLNKFFGGNTPSHLPSPNSLKGLGLLSAGAVVLWGLSGFYIVNEGNNGVETRFGAYTRTTQAGLNWHAPAPIEQVNLVNVKQQRFIEVGYRSSGVDAVSGGVSVPKEALMLTKDENYVDVRLAVQYQVKDAKAFLFNMTDPAGTLKQVTESAQRGAVGSSTMDFVLTEGRGEIVTQIKKEIQDVMDSYDSGIQITSVNLQDAQPPEQVQNSFADAIKAREDEQRLINEAQAYANDVVPRARGAAARKLQEAEGYKEQVIAQAEGETTRFTKLLTEYSKAPEITRKRLYLETMETVLSATNTVLIDVKAGNNLLYLPLDKMLQHTPAPSANAIGSAPLNASIDSGSIPPTPTTQEQPNTEHSGWRNRDHDTRGR